MQAITEVSQARARVSACKRAQCGGTEAPFEELLSGKEFHRGIPSLGGPR